MFSGSLEDKPSRAYTPQLKHLGFQEGQFSRCQRSTFVDLLPVHHRLLVHHWCDRRHRAGGSNLNQTKQGVSLKCVDVWCVNCTVTAHILLCLTEHRLLCGFWNHDRARLFLNCALRFWITEWITKLIWVQAFQDFFGLAGTNALYNNHCLCLVFSGWCESETGSNSIPGGLNVWRLAIYSSPSSIMYYIWEMVWKIVLRRMPETYLFFTKTKCFRAVHLPKPDGPNASRWTHVQKSTLSVFNEVKSPGQSFHLWRFLDKSAPPP